MTNMQEPGKNAVRKDRFIIASQYFLYFGSLGIYLPYFNLYCLHIGFNGIQIGVISAVRSVAVIFFPLVWGIVADRFQVRRQIFIYCCIISAFIWSFYLLTDNFLWMILITAFYAIFYAPIISFLEAFTMDVLGAEKKGYGRIRLWGSISFIMMVIFVGWAIDQFRVGIILVLILAASSVQSLIAFGVPPVQKKLSTIERHEGFRSFLTPKVNGFLFCAFLMLVSHGAYYGFFSIHLEQLGYGKTFIGLCWALGVVAEILVMFRSKQLFGIFSLENVLFFSFMAAVLRWLVLYFFDNPVIILLSQPAHAVTYGTFHMASILYIDRLSPESSKTSGQAVNNAVTYGLGLMVGFLVNGYFYEQMDSSFFLFLFSAIIAFIAGGLFLMVRRFFP